MNSMVMSFEKVTPESHNSTKIEYGGILFLLNNLSVYLPYTVMYCMAAFFGFFGNILIIATIIINKVSN
jgi:hypothetical protein